MNNRTKSLVRMVKGEQHGWILAPGGVAKIPKTHAPIDQWTQDDWAALDREGLLDDGFSDWYGVTQVITTACNLRCHYCFQNTITKGDNSRIQRIPSRTLTKHVLDNSLIFVNKQMSAIGANRVALTLFGGEPTLNMAECALTLERYKAQFAEVDAMMITNGYTLDVDSSKQLAQHGLDRVQITLDGDRESHDSTRISRAFPRTFDTILKNTSDALRETNLHVTIRINLTLENAHSIHDLLTLLASNELMRTERVGVDLAPVRGYPWNRALIGDTPAYSVLTDAFKYARELGFHVAVPEVRSCIHCTYLDAERGVVIGPSGELYSNWSAVGRLSQRVGTLSEGVTAPPHLWKSCMEFDGAEGVSNHGLTDSDDYISFVLNEIYGS